MVDLPENEDPWVHVRDDEVYDVVEVGCVWKMFEHALLSTYVVIISFFKYYMSKSKEISFPRLIQFLVALRGSDQTEF